MKIGPNLGILGQGNDKVGKLKEKAEDLSITAAALKKVIGDGFAQSGKGSVQKAGLYVKNTPVKLTRGGVAKSAGLGLLAAGIISLYGMPPLGVAATGGLFFFYALERLCPDKERMPENSQTLKPAPEKKVHPHLDSWVEALHSEKRMTRINALEVVLEYGDENKVEQIASVLNDPDHVVRGFAAFQMGKTDSRRAVPYLTEFLRTEHNREEKDWYNRREAVNALGSIGGKEAVKTLIGALEDESPEVREAAVSALKSNPDKNALAALAKYKIKQKLGKA